ncbi:MAG: hypothetical protein VZR00_03335 [Lachnospiraceae bacterium]|jgi:hypothetical protein|nr:hypothetical protein [Lachnospiraceae bacterium]MEE3460911.1 hypothetical protein [Lachnospiraceae bacterium]
MRTKPYRDTDNKVYLLHLELDIDNISDAAYDALQTYGKVEKGISRDVLVSSDISLHELHYLIQRTFGWRNSHLHKFCIPRRDFNRITGGTVPKKKHEIFGDDMTYADMLKFHSDKFQNKMMADDINEYDADNKSSSNVRNISDIVKFKSANEGNISLIEGNKSADEENISIIEGNKTADEGYASFDALFVNDDSLHYDGLFANWAMLCGMYFRFPTDNYEELYWDEDYDGNGDRAYENDGNKVYEGNGDRVNEDFGYKSHKAYSYLKSWLRWKYTHYEGYRGKSEHFIFAVNQVSQFIEQNRMIRILPSFGEWLKLEKDTKGERHQKIEKIKPIEQATVEEVQRMFEPGLDELLERLKISDVLCAPGEPKAGLKELEKWYSKNEKKFNEGWDRFEAARAKDNGLDDMLQDDYYWAEDFDDIPPVADEIIYCYDYGDDWQVKITCEAAYLPEVIEAVIKADNAEAYNAEADNAEADNTDADNNAGSDNKEDSDNEAAQDIKTIAANNKKSNINKKSIINKNTVAAGNGPSIGDITAGANKEKNFALPADLKEDIIRVYKTRTPRCIEADGLSLFDDAGGVERYAAFLRIIHSDRPDMAEEKAQLKEWSRGQGWTGRAVKPKNQI